VLSLDGQGHRPALITARLRRRKGLLMCRVASRADAPRDGNVAGLLELGLRLRATRLPRPDRNSGLQEPAHRPVGTVWLYGGKSLNSACSGST